MAERRRSIPRAALKPLSEYCQKLEVETGRPAAEILREYLELAKKHEAYFFSKPWPETFGEEYGLSREDVEFIGGALTFDERRDRFTLVCLRRNLSLDGFDSQGFENSFKSYGDLRCVDCAVHIVKPLRVRVREMQQARIDLDDEIKREEPSPVLRAWYDHLHSPETVRDEKIDFVELKLYEELGGASGKTCAVENTFTCPYGEESESLIEDGKRVKDDIWCHLYWYHGHWNRQSTFKPSSDEMKWYHWNEPGIIDLTSYEDVLKAFKDGRLGKIIDKHKECMKETGSSAWAP